MDKDFPELSFGGGEGAGFGDKSGDDDFGKEGHYDDATYKVTYAALKANWEKPGELEACKKPEGNDSANHACPATANE